MGAIDGNLLANAKQGLQEGNAPVLLLVQRSPGNRDGLEVVVLVGVRHLVCLEHSHHLLVVFLVEPLDVGVVRTHDNISELVPEEAIIINVSAIVVTNSTGQETYAVDPPAGQDDTGDVDHRVLEQLPSIESPEQSVQSVRLLRFIALHGVEYLKPIYNLDLLKLYQ